MARDRKYYPLFTNQAATGTTNVVDVRDFRNCVISTGTSGTATLTYKFQASLVKNDSTTSQVPDFTAAASKTNQWIYVQAIDLATGNSVAGATGVGITADECRLFEININSIDYLAMTVTAYTQGQLTSSLVLTENS